MMNDETHEFSGGHTKHGFEWIHLQLKSLESFIDQIKILYMVRRLFKLDHHIVNIALDIFMEHIIKNCLYCPLVSYSYIIKCEGHNIIGRNPFRCADSSDLLIF